MLLAVEKAHRLAVNQGSPLAMQAIRENNKRRYQNYMFNKYQDSYNKLFSLNIPLDICNIILEEADKPFHTIPRNITNLLTYTPWLRYPDFGRHDYSFVWGASGPTYPMNDALEQQMWLARRAFTNILPIATFLGWNDPTTLQNGNLLFLWPSTRLQCSIQGVEMIFPTYTDQQWFIQVTIRKFHVKKTRAVELWDYRRGHVRHNMHWVGWDNAAHGVEVRQDILNHSTPDFIPLRTISLHRAYSGDGDWVNFLTCNN